MLVPHTHAIYTYCAAIIFGSFWSQLRIDQTTRRTKTRMMAQTMLSKAKMSLFGVSLIRGYI